MNNSTAFSQAFSLIKQQFVKVVTTMDGVNIFGNFSVLDFFVAMLVFGAILPIVIITVNNWSGGAVSAANARDVSAKRREENRKYNEQRIANTEKYRQERIANTEKYRQARLAQYEKSHKRKK